MIYKEKRTDRYYYSQYVPDRKSKIVIKTNEDSWHPHFRTVGQGERRPRDHFDKWGTSPIRASCTRATTTNSLSRRPRSSSICWNKSSMLVVRGCTKRFRRSRVCSRSLQFARFATLRLYATNSFTIEKYERCPIDRFLLASLTMQWPSSTS
uniref:Uncharacterized protein n=1 Tax=Hyaloperonospora arabidopsidis (strain Emoy2) TaxID=559515 RepID=M4BHR6_HYAAE